MSVIYLQIFVFASFAWVVGSGLVLIPRRHKRGGYEYLNKLDQPRLLVPLADRLLERLSTVPVVVLPVVGSAMVVLAFISGELNDMETVLWTALFPGSSFLAGLQLVFTLIYVGVAGLVLAALGFVLRPRSGSSEKRTLILLGPADTKTQLPWQSCGGLRRWLTRGSAMGSWLAAAAVVLLLPTLLNLIFVIHGAREAAEAAEAAREIANNAPEPIVTAPRAGDGRPN